MKIGICVSAVQSDGSTRAGSFAEMAAQCDDGRLEVWHWRKGRYHATLMPFFRRRELKCSCKCDGDESRDGLCRRCSLFWCSQWSDDPYSSPQCHEAVSWSKPGIIAARASSARSIGSGLRAELMASYCDEDRAPEALIFQDLSHWLACPAQESRA